MHRPVLEALILDGFKERLMAPELIKEFIAEFYREVNRLSGERGRPGPPPARVE